MKKETKSATACCATTRDTSALMTMINAVLTMMKRDCEEPRKSRRHYSTGRDRCRGNDYKSYGCGSDQHLKRRCPNNKECLSWRQQGQMKVECSQLRQGNDKKSKSGSDWEGKETGKSI